MKETICTRCGKRKATVWYRESAGGETREEALCAVCAAEKELFAFPLFSAVSRTAREGSCPLCGTTLSRVKKEGKFGCSACYDTFASSLDLTPFVGSGYREREPEARGASASSVEELKGALQRALQEENYDEAARLRDAIREREGA